MDYHLFDVVGIELEYMVVRSSDLKVLPIVDELLTAKNGELTSDIENGTIGWSNELVAHVVELKTNGPTSKPESLSQDFHKNVQEINNLLLAKGAQLLPSAAHPLMNTKTEMQLWKHDYNEVYELYNRVFDCKGHGWANVQSMHINLPFNGDKDFEKLHAAVRIILPLLPGISASSPIFDGQITGFLDSRMEAYKTNQKEIPIMTGKVIPEQAFSKEEYNSQIFNPIKAAIKPFDPDNILEYYFLNSRGAIARFDRNAIEIRVIDIQECPKADVAIAILTIEVLKLLVSEEITTLKEQKKWHEDDLYAILNSAIKNGENSLITNLDYLSLFNIKKESNLVDVWKKLYDLVKSKIDVEYRTTLEAILKNGTLSTRILKAIGKDMSAENIVIVYRQLAACLQKNELFLP